MHVYVCMYVCMCARIYVCVYVYIYIYMHDCVCIHVCTHVRTYVRNVCLYVYIDVRNIRMYVCVYAYVTPFRDGSALIYIPFQDLTKLARIRTDRMSGLYNAVNCSGADSKPKSCVKVYVQSVTGCVEACYHG